MEKDNVLVFPDTFARSASNGIDPNLMLALNNNGGFGGGNAWYWIIFLWMMWNQNGRNGNFNDYVAQMNGSEGRQYLAEIMGGRFDNINTLAQIVNTGVETVKNGIFTLQSSIQSVGAQVGLTAAQTQNAIALGNASLAQQICQCCCENRLAICQQTNALQATLAANHAEDILRSSQAHAEDRLDVCQQTNDIKTQSLLNTQGIKDAIAAQSAMINDKFCDLEKRELQNKINMQGDIITQLRNQISNDHQTLQFNAAFHALDDKVDAIAAKQPNTVPVQWPNLVAANATPYVGQSYYPGFYGNYGGWGAGVNGGVIL